MSFKPYLKYLYIPAIILFVAGAIAGLTTGVWSTLYLSLIVVGVALFIGWLILLLITHPAFLARRSTQAGTNAFFVTIAILVIVAVLNLVAFRYGGKIDLTENQLFTLSPQTETVLSQLKQPVKIIIFDSNPLDSDKDLLKNYQRINDKFTFEFVNPDQQPGLVKEFKVKSQGDVFVQYGKKKELVQTLLQYNQRQPLSEIQLTNGIERIQGDRSLNVYFLQGHGEHPLNNSKEGISDAITGLENKGFKVNPLNLGVSVGIPDNTNAIVIAGPKRELLKPEVETLKQYSDRGGNLMIMVDPEVNPGLDPLLKQWGVKFDPRTFVDLSGVGERLGLGPAAPIITTYGEHPITKEFGNGISIFPLSRPIATVKTPDVKAVTLLEASDKMVAKKELTEDLKPDPKQDLLGPFDLGVALERNAVPPVIAPSPSPSVSPGTNASPNPLISPTPSLTPSPVISPSLKPVPSISPSSSPQPQLSPAIAPSPLVSPSPIPAPKPSVTSQRPQPQAKLVSYTLAQVQSPIPQISPSPSLSVSPSPSLSVSPSPNSSPSPSLSVSPSAQPTGKKVTSKMVVIGNAMFMTNQWFNEQLNGDIFLNSVQWLANKQEQPLAIRPKEPKNRRINLSSVQASAISWLSLVIFPLLGIGLGIVSWWRRR